MRLQKTAHCFCINLVKSGELQVRNSMQERGSSQIILSPALHKKNNGYGNAATEPEIF